MAEPVRLVIWDLDDTFWRGTLSEGPVDYVEAHHGIVVALAARGIVSSICSKNDHAPVEALLRERGLWDHFVFPSINWEAKGPRVAALIEAVQLRPETVLLIDDNPLNRNEALHYSPGIQVADETTILAMLDDPLFTGKDDAALTRLAQYRLLQRRKADEADAGAAAGDNHAFLRASGIRVTIDYDIAQHADRAIELVNRTNQLNFTKRRLPEDPTEARAAFAELIARFNVLCGMVRVQDRYGDYGWSGFFAIKRTMKHSYVIHFAFSCRILNMGVEQWLYRHLGSPKLAVVTPVSSELPGGIEPDWITLADGVAGGGEAVKDVAFVGLRGSCDLRPLEHYFAAGTEEIVSELMTVRRGMPVRVDHSLLLTHAMRGIDPAFMAACRPLNLMPEDFSVAALAGGPGRRAHVLSLKGDFKCAVYRHRATGGLIPVRLMKGPPRDYTLENPEELECPPKLRDKLLAHLAGEFSYVGALPHDELAASLKTILDAVLPTSLVVLILADVRNAAGRLSEPRVSYNDVVRGVAAGYANVRCFAMSDLARDGEMRDVDHYDRMVYHRAFEHIRTLLGLGDGSAQAVPDRLSALASVA